MMKTYFYISLWSLLPLVMVACSSTHHEQQTAGNLLARVGSEYLTRSEAKQAIPDYVFQFDSTRALKQYRTQWIDQQLALSKARELQLASHKAVQKRLREARREVLLGALKRFDYR